MSGWSTTLPDWLAVYWPHVSGLIIVLASVVAGVHAVLSHREVRSSIGWLGLILMVPLVGAVLYALFGVNRIKRRATILRGQRPPRAPLDRAALADLSRELDPSADERHGVGSLAELVGQVTRRPLLSGNRITCLQDGDEAYPAMLDAIAEAEHSVTLLTYIFDNDSAGRRFVVALAAAHRRGVAVRVLIDAAGARYSWPRIDRILARSEIPVARFLPLGLRVFRHFNLRNHRKIMVVDGRVGFTGGANIREGHVLESNPRRPVRDIHFRVEGPVVGQLQEVFAEDWKFATGESLTGDLWFPNLSPSGTCLARGIADGPDEDLDTLNWTLMGAIASAEHSIRIVTPYFLPDPPMAAALNTAALRGVDVEIILPVKSNLPYMTWATWGQLWTVLGHGCQIWMAPPPFDHSKLMVVDEYWVLFGSTNWDPRSLRLNFELNVEAYCPQLALEVGRRIALKKENARPVTQDDLSRRGLPVRLRDGVARLLSPYL